MLELPDNLIGQLNSMVGCSYRMICTQNFLRYEKIKNDKNEFFQIILSVPFHFPFFLRT